MIQRGSDGFFHPATDDEVVELVRAARAAKAILRVRGAAHSTPTAIGLDEASYDVMLDRMRAIEIVPDPSQPGYATVHVQGGCHLGKDPYDPTSSSTWGNSLNATLQRHGYALSDLGGITHQTVAGFLATGSSGGSTTYSIDDDIVGIRLVDGTGAVHDLSRDDADPAGRDRFFAAVVSLGLLGVVTRVTFRVRPSYALFGTQVTTPSSSSPIDLFGDGSNGNPSLATYLRAAPYARLMWWPQHGFDRMVVWQTGRIDPTPPGFTPNPYLELGRSPRVAALAGSLFYTLLGNLEDLSAVPAKLTDWYAALLGVVENDPDPNACVSPRAAERARDVTREEVLAWLEARLLPAFSTRPHLSGPIEAAPAHVADLFHESGQALDGAIPDSLAKLLVKLLGMLLDGLLSTRLAQLLADLLAREIPYLIDLILGPFVPDGTITFWDSWMCGLPMDNQMDDKLWPTVFTELWVPLDQAEAVMQALRKYYTGDGDPRSAYARTGAFSCEIYAAKKSEAWLSPSYGMDVLRIDVFWFGKNAGTPDAFYQGFWDTLAPFGFRPHWGKVLPPASETWRAYYRAQLPKLDAFLALRAQMDPDGVFLTPSWKANLVG